MQTLTPAERRLGWFMLGSGAIYLLVGIGFWVLPGLTQDLAGLAGRALGLADRPATPLPMWHPLGVSMMVTITTCCFLAGADPRRHRPFALPVIASKGTSTLVAATLLAAGEGTASALGVVLTDLPLFIATLALYAAAVRSVNGSWVRGGPP